MVAVVMVITPGANMIYLVSRSICQGTSAGIISLFGVVSGLVVYMLCAAFGITALIFSIPYSYQLLKFAGAMYLAYLGWQAIKPNGFSPFQIRQLPHDNPKKLFSMGLVTVLLNPKVAIIYVSLLPQFIDPNRGVLTQSLYLGVTQIFVAFTGNGLFVLTAGFISRFLSENPKWMFAQRWFMGFILIGLSVHIIFTQ